MQKALELDSANFQYLAEEAEAHNTLGNQTDAAQLFDQAHKMSPENQIVKAKLGKLLINLQDYREACRLLAELQTADSTYLFYLKNLAAAAFKQEKNKEAGQLYEEVLRQNPRDFSGYLNLASHLSAGHCLFRRLDGFGNRTAAVSGKSGYAVAFGTDMFRWKRVCLIDGSICLSRINKIKEQQFFGK